MDIEILGHTSIDEVQERRNSSPVSYDMSQRQVAAWTSPSRSLAPGSVLEPAGATGWWTERLARTAERLIVVDSSSDVLALNQERVGRSDVNHVVEVSSRPADFT